jgi:hypothetical protein
VKPPLIVVVSAVIVAVATVGVVYSLLDGSKPDCADGFDKADWERHKTGTGQAIAECDWFDGKPRVEVIDALGRPDWRPYRGWYTWELGSSRGGLGPASWFLEIRVQDGVVTKSQAKVRPT